jgi:hypothetical protein
VRTSLIDALASCAEGPVETRARRFLAGLSSDELQFMAAFLGACVLEPPKSRCASRAELAERIARYQQACTTRALYSADQEHKMILLLEYLCRCGLLQAPLPFRVGHFS